MNNTLEKEVNETLRKKDTTIRMDSRDRTLYYVIYPSNTPPYKGMDSVSYLIYTGPQEDLYKEILKDGIDSVIQKYQMKL